MSVQDFAWDADAAATLDILNQEDFAVDQLLDSATLTAVASAVESSLRIKRYRSEAPECAGDSSPLKAEAGDDSGDDFDEPQGSKKGSKGTCNAAARNKACREKARRERINERFVELATLLERGKEPKLDKSSILGDAIRAFQQLLAENNQLKQLNKFLEERVGQLEKAQGQQLYQQALYQAPHAALQQRPHMSGASLPQHFVTGVPCLQTGGLQGQAHAAGQADLSHQLLHAQHLLQDPRAVNATPAGLMLPAQTHPALVAAKAALLAGGVVPGADQASCSLPNLPYLIPGTAVDAWQDSVLRPPAA